LAGFNQGSAPQTLPDVLDRRAAERPGKAAFVFVPERGDVPLQITFAELRRQAHSVAARLAARFAKGERAVLLFPPEAHHERWLVLRCRRRPTPRPA
jgi:acyl-CoA synthetase (AMP-forming)/AMP-acid ligase II